MTTNMQIPRLAALLGLGAIIGACGAEGDDANGNYARNGTEPITRPDHTRYFPIDSGQHDGFECASCHGDIGYFGDFSCIGCHAHAEERVVPPHEGVTGFEYDATSCYACHPTGEASAVVDHDLAFPISAGTDHSGLDCGTCHSSATDRTLLGCTTCHEHREEVTTPAHDRVADYRFDSRACYDCHPDGRAVAAADHERFFPISAGQDHDAVDCDTCHASAEDRTLLACADCHEHRAEISDPRHDGITDYAHESRACYDCHPDSEANTLGDHDRVFPISATTVHEDERCSDCHSSVEDRTLIICADCHDHRAEVTDVAHERVEEYVFESRGCYDCHPSGLADDWSNHAEWFPIDPTSNHPDEACGDCHLDRQDRAQLACTTCHDHRAEVTDPAHEGVVDYDFESLRCFECHPQGDAFSRAEHADAFPIAAPAAHDQTGCTDCHLDPSDSARVTCVDCHDHAEAEMRQVHFLLDEYQWATSSCRDCHPRSEIDVDRTVHDVEFPIAAPTSHESARCADCHVNSADALELRCNGCHEHSAAEHDLDHRDVGGARTDAASCLKCHPLGWTFDLVDHTPFRVDPQAKHRAEKADCFECHPNTLSLRSFAETDFEVFDCLGCHERGETDGQHREEPTYRYVSTTCVQSGCHPNGQED